MRCMVWESLCGLDLVLLGRRRHERFVMLCIFTVREGITHYIIGELVNVPTWSGVLFCHVMSVSRW